LRGRSICGYFERTKGKAQREEIWVADGTAQSAGCTPAGIYGILSRKGVRNMASATLLQKPTVDTDIFLRLWDQQHLTPTLARHLLKMSFSDDDGKRMDELAAKNQEGEISPAELAELDSFVRVGTVLSILQSRARKLLKRPVSQRNGSA
jgi:hypothetical protein